MARALNHIRNITKAKIIAWLRANPSSTRKAIVDGLDVASPTVSVYLGELEQDELIVANPPRATRKRGEWVTYRVNDAAVADAYLRFGQELGEI